MARDCDNTACSRESCEGCPSAQNPNDLRAPMNAGSRIHHVIGIISGKGGVGKSTVTAELAVALRREGWRVGILDADITGPSIPRMFGVSDVGGVVAEQMIPARSETGIRIMSVNLVLEDETQPVIWRGPVLAGVIKQFWTDVIWGDLDFLLVDMPPGTGDVALTVFQSLPVDGVLMVTSPQSLVEMIVQKAYHMAALMEIPVLGIVENFSYLQCPDCGRKIAVFGESRTEALAQKLQIPFLGQLPLDSEFPAFADEGRVELYPDIRVGKIVEALEKLEKTE